MKYLIEFNPPAEVKNAFELSPKLQKKVGQAIKAMKTISAWFTMRYGFFVIEAKSVEDIAKKTGPLMHLFKTDVNVSPAFSLEEFPKLVAAIGKEAKKYA